MPRAMAMMSPLLRAKTTTSTLRETMMANINKQQPTIANEDNDKPLADEVNNKYTKGNDDDKYAKGKDDDEYARGNNNYKYAEGNNNN